MLVLGNAGTVGGDQFQEGDGKDHDDALGSGWLVFRDVGLQLYEAEDAVHGWSLPDDVT